MSKKKQVFSVFVLSFLVSNWCFSQTTWTGTTNDDWNVATNWSAGVPDATDDVTINSTGGKVVISAAGAVARSVTINGFGWLEVQPAGNLTLNGSLSNGIGVLANGKLDNNGVISITLSNVGLLGISNFGLINNNPSSQLYINNARSAAIYNQSGGFLYNNGLIQIGQTLGGTYAIQNNGSVNNEYFGVIKTTKVNIGVLNQDTFQNNGLVEIDSTGRTNYGLYNAKTFINYSGGRIQVTMSKTGTGIANTESASVFTSEGRIEFFGSGFVSSVALANENGARFDNVNCGFINIESNSRIFSSSTSPFTNSGYIVERGDETISLSKINVNSGTIYNLNGGVFEIISGAAAITDELNPTWTGCSSSDWHNSANWIPNAPVAGDAVTINNGPIDPIISSGHVTLNSLTINSDASLKLDGWDLTLEAGGTFTNNGDLTINNSSTLFDYSSFTNNGTTTINADSYLFLVENGDLSNSGTVILNQSGTLGYSQNAASGEHLLPEGTFTWNGGTIRIGPNAIVKANGDLVILNNANIKNYSGHFSSDYKIDNYWDIYNYGGTFTINGTLNNYGSIFNQGEISAKMTSTGSLENYNNITLKGNSSFTGVYTSYAGSELIFQDNLNVVISPNLESGWGDQSTVQIGTGSKFTLSSDLTVKPGRIFKVSGEVTIPNGLKLNDSSQIINNGKIFCDAGGEIVNTAQFKNLKFLQNDGTFRNQAKGVLTTEDSLINNGTFTNLNLLEIKFPGVFLNNGILDNSDAASTIDLQQNGKLIFNTTPAYFPESFFIWNGIVEIGSSGHLFFNGLTPSIPTAKTLINKGEVTVSGAQKLLVEGYLTNEGTIHLKPNANFIYNPFSYVWPGGTLDWQAGSYITLGPESDVSLKPFILTSDVSIPTDAILINNANLDNQATLTNRGNITNGKGLLSNNGVLHNYKQLTIEINSLNAVPFLNKGSFTSHLGAIINLNDDFNNEIAAVFINDGTLNLNNGAFKNHNIYTNNGSFLNNMPSSSISNEATGHFINFGTVINKRMVNYGKITNQSTGVFTVKDYLQHEGEWINNGSLTTNHDAFNYGFFTNNGTFNLTKIPDYTYSLLINGNGAEMVNNGIVNLTQTWSYNHGLWIHNGTFIISGNSSFTNEDGGNYVLNTNPVLWPIANNFKWESGSSMTIGPNGVYDINAPMTIETGRTFTIEGIFNNNSTLNLNFGAKLLFNANPVNWPAATFNWNSGGEVIIGADAVFDLSNHLEISALSTLTNKGIMNVKPTGTLTETGLLTNEGELNLEGNLVLNNTPASLPSSTFNWKDDGKLSIGADGDLTLTAIFDIDSSRVFEVIGNLTNNGTINLNRKANLLFNGTTNWPIGGLNWAETAQITIGSDGDVNLVSPMEIPEFRTLNVAGNLTNSSTLHLREDGLLVFNSNTGEWPAGNFIWDTLSTVKVGQQGFLSLNQNVEIKKGRTLFVNGNMENNAEFINYGNLEIFGGSFVNKNLFTNRSVTKVDEAGFENEGVVMNYDTLKIDLYSFATNYAEGRIQNFHKILNYSLWDQLGTVVNESDGEIHNFESGFLTNYNSIYNHGLLVNLGTMGSFDSLMIYHDAIFNNVGEITSRGLIKVNGVFNNFGYLENDGTSVNTSILSGDGQINNSGTIKNTSYTKIHPGDDLGKLKISGDFETGASQMEIEINGSINFPDTLEVQGDINLTNGKLKINWVNPPTSEVRYTIATFNTKTGEFLDIQYEPVAGWNFQINYLANSIEIAVLKACQSSQFVNEAISEDKTVLAGQTVTGTATIQINTKVIFSAGSAIILEPGFEAKNGSVFLADIGGCVE